MARVMSKVISSDSSRDVLASIRKLVADEAQQEHPQAPKPLFAATVRTPDPAAVPFRHTSGARDWLVGAIDEGKRAAEATSGQGVTKPLFRKTTLALGSAANSDREREWKPRISLALVNQVEAEAPRAEVPAASPKRPPERPEQADATPKAPDRRFQPWKPEAIDEGLARFQSTRDAGRASSRLLLTAEYRVPSPDGAANQNTVAPRHRPRFTLTPAYTEDSDLVDPVPAKPAATDIPASQKATQTAPTRPEPSGEVVGTVPRSLDEAVLRDVVAGVVREELRGALGERITRNVRKLVRSEINRAVEAAKLSGPDGDEIT